MLEVEEFTVTKEHNSSPIRTKPLSPPFHPLDKNIILITTIIKKYNSKFILYARVLIVFSSSFSQIYDDIKYVYVCLLDLLLLLYYTATATASLHTQHWLQYAET